MNKHLKWLVPSIFILAFLAATAGLWPADGTSYPLTNFRGEQVTINARGLYYWDTLSIAAQSQANDLVTLVIGLPMLAISYYFTLRGSLRGRLLMTGTLGFFLYTYASMCFGTALNKLFLVYVALFSMSLFAFILGMMSFDLKSLPAHFSEKLPRKAIAAVLFLAAAFLSLAWLGRIAAYLFQDQIPALDNITSMFIQAMDLGLIVPLCMLSGILLLQRKPWGYLLASVGMVKFLTLGTSVTLMGLNMLRVGVPVSMVELGIFPVISILNIVMTILLLKNISKNNSHPVPAITG